MDNEAQREMTLDEWCEQLLPAHTVNRQLAELKAEAALRATGEGGWVPALDVFRIAGGDVECSPRPSTEQALDCLRDLRDCYDEALREANLAAGMTAAPTPAEPTNPGETSSKVVEPLRECTDADCSLDREGKMVMIARNEAGKSTVWCDPCIAPIVKALNDAGIRTVASCCGHKRRPGVIALEDRRELFIARDFDEARRIDTLFPATTNDPLPEEPLRDAGAVDAFVKRLQAYADQEYVRGSQIANRDECRGWEAKATAGKFGEPEYRAHERFNRHMGAHFGIYEAIRTALAAPQQQDAEAAENFRKGWQARDAAPQQPAITDAAQDVWDLRSPDAYSGLGKARALELEARYSGTTAREMQAQAITRLGAALAAAAQEADR